MLLKLPTSGAKLTTAAAIIVEVKALAELAGCGTQMQKSVLGHQFRNTNFIAKRVRLGLIPKDLAKILKQIVGHI